MKAFLIILTLSFACCARRNPYYNLALSYPPYEVFFEESQEHRAFILINSDSASANIFSTKMPDSLGGKNIEGECIVEISFQNRSMEINKVNIVAIVLHEETTDHILGFDRYHGNRKYVDKTPDKTVTKYLPFVKETAKNLKFKKNETGAKRKYAYCKILFLDN